MSEPLYSYVEIPEEVMREVGEAGVAYAAQYGEGAESPNTLDLMRFVMTGKMFSRYGLVPFVSLRREKEGFRWECCFLFASQDDADAFMAKVGK